MAGLAWIVSEVGSATDFSGGRYDTAEELTDQVGSVGWTRKERQSTSHNGRQKFARRLHCRVVHLPKRIETLPQIFFRVLRHYKPLRSHFEAGWSREKRSSGLASAGDFSTLPQIPLI